MQSNCDRGRSVWEISDWFMMTSDASVGSALNPEVGLRLEHGDGIVLRRVTRNAKSLQKTSCILVRFGCYLQRANMSYPTSITQRESRRPRNTLNKPKTDEATGRAPASLGRTPDVLRHPRTPNTWPPKYQN